MSTLSRLDTVLPSTAAESVALLYNELSTAGATHLYMAGDQRIAVLSIRRGLSVWCLGGAYRWQDENGIIQTHRADDPAGVIRRIGLLPTPARVAA